MYVKVKIYVLNAEVKNVVGRVSRETPISRENTVVIQVLIQYYCRLDCNDNHIKSQSVLILL